MTKTVRKAGVGLAVAASLWAAGAAAQEAVSASVPLRAEVLKQGLLECYPAGAQNGNGNRVYCEASAVNVQGSEMIVANDKPQQKASFIRYSLQGPQPAVSDEPPQYLSGGALSLVSKIEGMTATPDGKWVLATTAFDRIEAGSAQLDPYNVLLAWPAGKPAQAGVVEPSSRGGVTSSLQLRQRLERYLGKPYFKVEGLAALPGNRLLFGVRELGEDHADFEYRVLIVEIGYAVDGEGNIRLGDGFSTLLDFSPAAEYGLPEGLGLSSIEFNPQTRRLFLLTSTENEGRLGAYLWHIALDDLDAAEKPLAKPRPVVGSDDRPVHFDNKAEGMSFIDRDTLIVIHDNDRIVGGPSGRQPHQAPYDILRIRQ